MVCDDPNIAVIWSGTDETSVWWGWWDINILKNNGQQSKLNRIKPYNSKNINKNVEKPCLTSHHYSDVKIK